jgi:hypothetical protein
VVLRARFTRGSRTDVVFGVALWWAICERPVRGFTAMSHQPRSQRRSGAIRRWWQILRQGPMRERLHLLALAVVMVGAVAGVLFGFSGWLAVGFFVIAGIVVAVEVWSLSRR